MLRVIAFDFDGVIVDSNRIKREAYYRIFSSFKYGKEMVEDVLNKFEPNTRTFIISATLERLTKKGVINIKNISEYRGKLVKEYGKICEKEVLKCNEIKDAVKSIRELSTKYNLYVNSLTPTRPLIRIIKKRGLSKYFRGIFGANKSKDENLKIIIREERIHPSQLLFVGDNVQDSRIAKKNKVNFIKISKDCSHLCENIERINAE